ncbi:MAG: polyprenyl synthetase family protein [Candidatus Margulisiibacteriota bacterium]
MPFALAIKTHLDAVETRLSERLLACEESGVRAINVAMVASPGKRLRPILCLLSYFATARTPRPDQIYNIAAALELIHMASLVHDDIIDHAPLRHDRPSVQAQWGPETATAYGVYLYAESLAFIAESDNRDVLRAISETVRYMCLGEMRQVFDRGNWDLDTDSYLRILEQKTGVLFSAACRSGAIMADASDNQIAALGEFGRKLGVVFQLTDDYLDVLNDGQILGKDGAQDFKMGEPTMPVILLLQRVPPAEKADLIRLLSAPSQPNYQALLSRVRASQALAETLAIIHRTLDEAVTALSVLPDSGYKKGFLKVVDAILERVKP